jgi:hypothetical protein
MFGLRAFFKLVIDGDGSSQKDHMKAAMIQTELGNSMVGGMGGPQKKFEAEQFLKGEIENLELFKYKSVLEDADRRLLGKRYISMAKGSKRKTSGREPGFDIFGTSASSSTSAGGKVSKRESKKRS